LIPFKKLEPIRIFLFDVDGVLTDGRFILDNNGVESKNFSIRDGLGLKWLASFGYEVGLVTGRSSEVVRIRAEELGLAPVFQGVTDKLGRVGSYLADRGLDLDQVAFAGDDLVDMPVMRRCGFRMAPSDAVPEIRALADYVSPLKGGLGAARDMVDQVLKGLGLWPEILARYA
jgi:3-deoxy-D-manno-octulosonate 8-phosphate phosphatase (KDO 8-P phosphatase)